MVAFGEAYSLIHTQQPLALCKVEENVPAGGGTLSLGQTIYFHTSVTESLPITACTSWLVSSDSQTLLPWEQDSAEAI